MNCPVRPDMELINIKSDAAVAMFLALSVLVKNNIGLKNIPPPMPTTPDIKPIVPPIKIAIILGIFLYISIFSSKDLNLISNKVPARAKTIKSKISKNSLSIDREPPMNASGTDDIKYGVNILRLIFPAFIKLKQFPETTIILQKRAIIGKIKYETSQINRRARYVEPPPNPTLEYNVAVRKNKNDNINTIINLNL